MKRLMFLLIVFVVTGILFPGVVSAATTAPADYFDVIESSSVVQTGINSLEAAPMNGMVSLVAAPGNNFLQQNGQLCYKTPTSTYQVGFTGASSYAMSSARVTIQTPSGIRITITTDRPVRINIQRIQGGWRITISPL